MIATKTIRFEKNLLEFFETKVGLKLFQMHKTLNDPRLTLGSEISLLSQDSSFPEGLSLTVEKVSTSPNDIVEVSSVSQSVPHSIYDGISNTIIRIDSLQLGAATLTVTDHQTGFSASAEIHVHDSPVIEEEPPETLEWKNSSMSVTVEKTRSLLLKAPIELEIGRASCRERV